MALTVGLSVAAMTYFLVKSQSDNVLLDIQVLRKIVPVGLESKKKAAEPVWSFADEWSNFVKRSPEKVCLKFIEENDNTTSLTFRQIDEWSNKVANAFRSIGVKAGEVVALLMENKPEFVAIWLGLAKIGAVSALINTNLRDKPLLHSFKTSNANKFIIGQEHLSALTELEKYKDVPEYNFLKEGSFYLEGPVEAPGFTNFNIFIKDQPNKLVGGLPPQRNASDPLLYIYTSGTTGLPKASIITNLRVYAAGAIFSTGYGLKNTDIYYCCLPFYHSAATLIAASAAMYTGIPLVFRRKFSARKFWTDCLKHNCTVAQYIGELCHYLMERPPSSDDKNHHVRLMIGNGMRANIWEKFKTRFNIAQIGEFYAATEGTTTLFNLVDKTGSVGYIPKLMLKLTTPMLLIRYDVEKDEIARNKDGNCVVCKPGEVGQLVGLIDPLKLADFRGYTSKDATEKKILRNAFTKGDAWYLSGDLLKQDKDGFYYFVDRIGDTFRWKGENVATGEVESVIESFPGVHEVNVYGVTMPNTSGRAGMAHIVKDETFDLKKFYDYTQEKLPSYAVPLFIRFGKQIEITGTLKHMKTTCRQEGFDPNVVKDPLFFRDKESNNYIPLSNELHKKLIAGQAKL